jgi:hypothetical protein
VPAFEELQDANGDQKAIAYLKEAVASGEHWYRALLKAIHLWSSTEEDYNDRRYTYLISGEAFDWLLLAERLTEEIRDFVPEAERINLLFFDKPPIELTTDEFKKAIGAAKYRAYLNYLYGVLSEEALIMATTNEVRKDQQSLGMARPEGETDEAFSRIYESTESELLHLFRKEKKYVGGKSTSLTEMKEFLYWLFTYRVKRSDKSRVASDTRKALLYMQRNLASKRLFTA